MPPSIADWVSKRRARVGFIVQDAAIKRVVPNWAERIGGPDSEIAALFNEKVKPIIGVEIQSSGLVARVEGK